VLDKKGKLRPSKFSLSRVLYTIAPKKWELAPLRDYLINDASAMIMSHLNEIFKGENESNPRTTPSLDAMTDEEFRRAYSEFMDPEALLVIKPQQREKIDAAVATGETRVARRLVIRSSA